MFSQKHWRLPTYILAHFCQTCRFFHLFVFQLWSPPGSFSFELIVAYMVRSDTDVTWPWSSACFSGYFCWLFVCHSQYPSVQSVVDFPCLTTFREVGYTLMSLKLSKNYCNCNHRNRKLLGDGPLLYFSLLLVYVCFSFWSPQKNLFFPSLVLVQCGAHNDAKYQSDFFSPLITKFKTCGT